MFVYLIRWRYLRNDKEDEEEEYFGTVDEVLKKALQKEGAKKAEIYVILENELFKIAEFDVYRIRRLREKEVV